MSKFINAYLGGYKPFKLNAEVASKVEKFVYGEGKFSFEESAPYIGFDMLTGKYGETVRDYRLTSRYDYTETIWVVTTTEEVFNGLVNSDFEAEED